MTPTNLTAYRARTDRCAHLWREVREADMLVERCADCDVLRSPRLHPPGLRPGLPPLFNRLLSAAS